MISAERQQSRDELMKAVVLGTPGSERVRDLFLIQHFRYPDGNTAALATMAWSPRLTTVVVHPDGIPMPWAYGDGVYAKPGLDACELDALGYEAFHHETYGGPSGEDPEEINRGTRSVVTVRDGRIIGWLSGRETDAALVAADTTPTGFNADRCAFMPPLKASTPCIELAWVAKNHRGRGVAREMVVAFAALWGLSPNRMAYGLPFTEAGFRLARSAAGPRFLAATQGILTYAADRETASTLAHPDATIELPTLTPEQVTKLDRMSAAADEFFDFGNIRQLAMSTPSKPRRRRDVRRAQVARGSVAQSLHRP